MPKAPKPPHKFLTQELIDKICLNVRSHNSIVTSYRMEGVTERQFALLMEEAEADPTSLPGQLKDRIEVAEAQAEAEGVNAVNTLADQGHPGAIMWRQERRYGGHWGKAEGKAPSRDSGSSVAPQIMLPPNGRETPQS